MTSLIRAAPGGRLSGDVYTLDDNVLLAHLIELA
jgi:hypothetical protein